MADNTKFVPIPLNLESVEELNRRVNLFSVYVLSELDTIRNQPSLSVGFYDQTTDQVVSNGNIPLDAATNYQPGQYYTLVVGGTFVTPIAELNGLAGATGDRIVSDGAQWILVTASNDFLSAVVDDTAAGVITHTQTPIINGAMSIASHATRKDYVDSADVSTLSQANNYTDNAVTAHEDEIATPDPHSQYTLEAQALDTFVGAGYGGMISNVQRAGPDLGAGWYTLEYDALQISTPRDVVLDLVTNTFLITRQGVWIVGAGFTFEHNSSNQGRLTNIRLFNVDDAVEINRIVVATGRNAEATNFFQGNIFEVGPTEVNRALRFEIGGGDAYSSVQWDQTTMVAYNVGLFSGVFV